MRLLLLLSALLSALTGVNGSRVQAQPVAAASAAGALAATSGVALVRRTPASFAAAAPVGLSPATLPPTPRLVSAVVARRLFVERRRE